MSAAEVARLIVGLLFLGWFGSVIYTAWKLTRPWKLEGKSDKGELDPHSDEFRRLILK